jgi:hypothetical protein
MCTSSTVAEAGRNLSSNAFVFTVAITCAAVKAPASTCWLWADFPVWYTPFLSMTDALHGLPFGRTVHCQ